MIQPAARTGAGALSFAVLVAAVVLVSLNLRPPRSPSSPPALATIGPFLVGMIHDATGDWTLVLVVLMATGLPLTLAGLRVARPTYVDDEIAAR